MVAAGSPDCLSSREGSVRTQRFVVSMNTKLGRIVDRSEISEKSDRTAQNLPLHHSFHQVQFEDRFPDRDRTEYSEGVDLWHNRSQIWLNEDRERIRGNHQCCGRNTFGAFGGFERLEQEIHRLNSGTCNAMRFKKPL